MLVKAVAVGRLAVRTPLLSITSSMDSVEVLGDVWKLTYKHYQVDLAA